MSITRRSIFSLLINSGISGIWDRLPDAIMNRFENFQFTPFELESKNRYESKSKQIHFTTATRYPKIDVAYGAQISTDHKYKIRIPIPPGVTRYVNSYYYESDTKNRNMGGIVALTDLYVDISSDISHMMDNIRELDEYNYCSAREFDIYTYNKYHNIRVLNYILKYYAKWTKNNPRYMRILYSELFAVRIGGREWTFLLTHLFSDKSAYPYIKDIAIEWIIDSFNKSHIKNISVCRWMRTINALPERSIPDSRLINSTKSNAHLMRTLITHNMLKQQIKSVSNWLSRIEGEKKSDDDLGFMDSKFISIFKHLRKLSLFPQYKLVIKKYACIVYKLKKPYEVNMCLLELCIQYYPPPPSVIYAIIHHVAKNNNHRLANTINTYVPGISLKKPPSFYQSFEYPKKRIYKMMVMFDMICGAYAPNDKYRRILALKGLNNIQIDRSRPMSEIEAKGILYFGTRARSCGDKILQNITGRRINDHASSCISGLIPYVDIKTATICLYNILRYYDKLVAPKIELSLVHKLITRGALLEKKMLYNCMHRDLFRYSILVYNDQSKNILMETWKRVNDVIKVKDVAGIIAKYMYQPIRMEWCEQYHKKHVIKVDDEERRY